MTDKITVKAPAKINLFLEVTGKLENGYHSLETVMHSVSLFDTVTVEKTSDGKISLFCDNTSVPCNETNLAYRAAVIFYEKLLCDECNGLKITIDKKIPIAAGMAGGSADAAGVLWALNHLYGDRFTEAELCTVGKALGADVPFCIVKRPMLCYGIGEIMMPVSPLPDCDILVAIKSGEKISTKEAYAKIDSLRNRAMQKCGLEKLLENGDILQICRGMFNIFSYLVPETDEIRNIMLRCGAVGAMMSGSGPSVFGIFTDKVKIQKSAEALEKLGCRVYFCKGYDGK